MTNSAVLIIALTLWGEARGECPEGQRAVASVIANRARARGLTPAQVCLQPYQFSAWNGRKLADLLPPDSRRRTPAWLRCLLLARELNRGDFTPSGPWDHYVRHDCWPSWRKAAVREDRIGEHVFMVLQ